MLFEIGVPVTEQGVRVWKAEAAVLLAGPCKVEIAGVGQPRVT